MFSGNGPVTSKESGFFAMMLFLSIVGLIAMGLVRGMWRADFAIHSDIGNEYLCFCVVGLLIVLATSLYGTLKTRDADEMIFGAENHIISDCGMVNVHNASVNPMSDEAQDDAASCTPATGQCGAVEKMAYASLSFVLLSGTCCIMTGLRLEQVRASKLYVNISHAWL